MPVSASIGRLIVLGLEVISNFGIQIALNPSLL